MLKKCAVHRFFCKCYSIHCNRLVTRRTQECPKTFSGDISPGSILVRYWYTWDVPRNKIISTWQLHRRCSRHRLDTLWLGSGTSQDVLRKDYLNYFILAATQALLETHLECTQAEINPHIQCKVSYTEYCVWGLSGVVPGFPSNDL